MLHKVHNALDFSWKCVLLDFVSGCVFFYLFVLSDVVFKPYCVIVRYILFNSIIIIVYRLCVKYVFRVGILAVGIFTIKKP